MSFTKTEAYKILHQKIKVPKFLNGQNTVLRMRDFYYMLKHSNEYIQLPCAGKLINFCALKF
jgi:hypothetical protein